MRALVALSKFMGVYDYFKALMKRYDLKWAGKSTDDLIIERLTKADNGSDVVEWIKGLKRDLPMLSNFGDLIAASGLRFEEAVNSYNLIITLAKQGRLQEYYNAEREALEHFRYKDVFIRRSKKVFINFIPKDLVDEIKRSNALTVNMIQNRVKRMGLRSRFSDVREFYASYMTKHLKVPEIDFIQGRISASVFMRHYFNPAWIGDLKERTVKGIREILAMTS